MRQNIKARTLLMRSLRRREITRIRRRLCGYSGHSAQLRAFPRVYCLRETQVALVNCGLRKGILIPPRRACKSSARKTPTAVSRVVCSSRPAFAIIKFSSKMTLFTYRICIKSDRRGSYVRGSRAIGTPSNLRFLIAGKPRTIHADLSSYRVTAYVFDQSTGARRNRSRLVGGGSLLMTIITRSRTVVSAEAQWSGIANGTDVTTPTAPRA